VRILRGLSGSGLIGRAMRLGVEGGGHQHAGAEDGDGGSDEGEAGHGRLLGEIRSGSREHRCPLEAAAKTCLRRV
jgi:hypothetical protein